MKNQNYMITIQFPDGTTQEYIVKEPVEKGTLYKGGTVIGCHCLKRNV